MAKKEKKASKTGKKAGSLLAEFKAFISKGNVLDMAVGVIIGGAFGAIVTALVNMLMSLCTWGIPGGIAGLISVLPAVPGNAAQMGYALSADTYIRQFSVSEFTDVARQIGLANGAADPVTYGTNFINANFSKYGGQWVWNGAAIINWGALINAVISFIIIALVLFIIIKIAAVVRAKKAEMDAKLLEAYYVKHPEERPVPAEPGVPEPTTNELLTKILDALTAEKK